MSLTLNSLSRSGFAAMLLLAGAATAAPTDKPGTDTPKPQAADKTDADKMGKPADKMGKPEEKSDDKKDEAKSGYFQPEQSETEGSVTVGGRKIDYRAIEGTLVVHPKDWDDAPQKADKDDKGEGDKNPTAEASMSYVAYLAKGTAAEARPLMFLFNGGPGSSSVWLHMGAFGPRRVVTLDDAHSPAAPYQVVNNDSSLLDVADLVFIDAPGTGFGRLAGPGKEKAFLGVDADAHAFADFITAFLGKYGRWNSPKYLFGESYGTTRSAVLVNMLETDRNVDLNGVIMLSQILNFDFSADQPEGNPGVDLPYQLALPTYAATAFYHKKLPQAPKDLRGFLQEVEQFAMGEYAAALSLGSMLPDDQRKAVVDKLHRYTGLPEAYIRKANLRINGGEFEKMLQDEGDVTTGRLDTRFSGPTIDPLSKEADYDPQSAAISSAYVSAFNDYVRRVLKFGDDKTYRPITELGRSWNFAHAQPGGGEASPFGMNVMPDLAMAMKYNPNLKVQLNGGYYDLATPYFEGIYEMHQLPMQKQLQANIEYKQYESGHMVYAHAPALRELHDNVAGFVKRTDNLK